MILTYIEIHRYAGVWIKALTREAVNGMFLMGRMQK